jgi:hypothetical protein
MSTVISSYGPGSLFGLPISGEMLTKLFMQYTEGLQ